MVLPAEGGGDYMATTRDERSKILHNFTFPGLKWGNQRFLRCEKINSGAGDQRLRRRSSTSKFEDATPFCVGGGYDQGLETEPLRSTEKEGIEEFRVKMMLDLRTVVDKMMSESIFRKQALNEAEEEKQTNDKDEKPKEREVSPPEATGEAVKARPWNLRKRRAPIPENENQNNYRRLGVEEKRVMNCSILGKETAKERPKFLLTLSKKEIEDDYMKMMGHRPPRRPKKRLRTVQKQVDLLKPAFYITEINEDLY